MQPIVENRFEYRGYPCVVIFQPMCHRCGYVGIPKRHAIDVKAIDCHGGITYTDKSLFGQDDKDRWWIGFDCAHWRDGHDWDAGREYWKDDPDALNRIDRLRILYENIDGSCIAKTQYFVENECKHIVEQLIEAEDER